MNKIDLTGKVFGRLTVLKDSDERTKDGNIKWVCQCECGNIINVSGRQLTRAYTKSCGCLNIEIATKRLKKHGQSCRNNTTPEYSAWLDMKQRCTNPKVINYALYGARGIKVCERWVESFEAFFEDMGKRPTVNHSLGRKNNNGNYEPENCKWTSLAEQCRNKRSNRWVEYNGQRMIKRDWALFFNIDKNHFIYLLKTTPMETIYNDHIRARK